MRIPALKACGFLVACVLLSSTACSAATRNEIADISAGARFEPPAQLLAYSGIPRPSALKRSSDLDCGVFHYGDEYEQGLDWPYQNVTAGASASAVFTPYYYGSTSSPEKLAYAAYEFDVSSYEGANLLFTEWLQTGSSYEDCWIGMADFTQDNWHWYNISPSNLIAFDGDSCIDAGAAYAIALFMGTTTWELGCIHLGMQKPPKILSVNHICGYEGEELKFKATLDPEMGDAAEWSWDFAGGTTPATSTDAEPSVTLGTPAPYEIVVRASNNAGAFEYAYYFNICPSDADWEIEVAHHVEDWEGIGGDTSLALDPEFADPHILYPEDQTADLDLLSNVGDGWSREDLDYGIAVAGTGTSSLAFDSHNNAHVVFYDGPWLVHGFEQGGSWQFEDLVTAEDPDWAMGDYYRPSLVLDADDNIHIAFTFDGMHMGWDLSYLFHMVYDGTEWQEREEATEDYGEFQPCSPIDVDSAGVPGIAYHLIKKTEPELDELRFAKWNPTTEVWDDTTIGDGTGAARIDMVISQNSDRPYVSYRTDADGGTLFFGYYLEGGWTVTQVFGTGFVGEYLSMAISEDDDIYICYYEAFADDLRLAKRDFMLWDIETVEAAGDVGMYCDIALNAAGQPHLSYFDATNQCIKYARMRIEPGPG